MFFLNVCTVKYYNLLYSPFIFTCWFYIYLYVVYTYRMLYIDNLYFNLSYSSKFSNTFYVTPITAWLNNEMRNNRVNFNSINYILCIGKPYLLLYTFSYVSTTCRLILRCLYCHTNNHMLLVSLLIHTFLDLLYLFPHCDKNVHAV